ncbi:MAG: RNA 2',3'-cyclic phosphodiesterase [Nesterenkonia sp.]
MRLFASLVLPHTAAEHLQMAVRSVEAAAPDPSGGRGRPLLRWVPFEQRHITLGFFGEVPAGAVDDLTEHLAAALTDLPPFPVRIRGAGVFAGRTLWAGVQYVGAEHTGAAANSTPLQELMRISETTGAEYARSPESVAQRDRRRAHVTLARARSRRDGEEQLRTRAEALAVYEGPTWTVTEAHLGRSELGQGRSGGPLYTTLAELPLSG